jgi:putative membrane protein
VVALLGTAAALVVGFKNTQTYNRTWEARQIWGATMGAGKAWAVMCLAYLDQESARKLIYRQLAWITALRFQLRTDRHWESINRPYNREYKKKYRIPEKEIPLEKELEKYISKEEVKYILNTRNHATQLLALQSHALKELFKGGLIDNFSFLAMHEELREFTAHQGKSERIKNFPYPRQYATISNFLVKLFCLLLPFGMLKEFDTVNTEITGFLNGKMVWLVVPFSILIAWVYTSLDQVGESTENPFEGGANDVPISQMARAVEIDIREMLGESKLPEALQPQNNILL